MKLLKKNEKGMTLVEILAAITILGIVFVGVLAIFPQMTNTNQKTERKLEAMNLARVELNELKEQVDNQLLLNTYGPPESKGRYNDSNNPKRTVFSTSQKRNGKAYDYEIIHYEESDANLEVEDQGHPEIRDGKLISLYVIHIKIMEEERVISETFGYVPYEVVGTDYH